MNRRRAAALGGAMVSLAVVALLAAEARPQGNVARAAPHAVVAGIVIAGAARAGWGWRAAMRVTAGYAALTSAAVALHLLVLVPIPYAECGTLFEELGSSACRRHAHKHWVGASVASAFAVIALITAARSRPTSTERHRGAAANK